MHEAALAWGRRWDGGRGCRRAPGAAAPPGAPGCRPTCPLLEFWGVGSARMGVPVSLVCWCAVNTANRSPMLLHRQARLLGGGGLQGRGCRAAPRPPTSRQPALCTRCQADDGAGAPSTSGACSAAGPQHSRTQQWARLAGPVTLFGASAAPGLALLPGLAGGGSGGGHGRGGGGDGGGGGQAGGGGQPQFDVAVVESEDSEAGGQEQRGDAWKELVTPSDEIEAGGEGQRAGTNRCVEVVLEGWPSVGSLPSEVRMGAAGTTWQRGAGCAGRVERGRAAAAAHACVRVRMCPPRTAQHARCTPLTHALPRGCAGRAQGHAQRAGGAHLWVPGHSGGPADARKVRARAVYPHMHTHSLRQWQQFT